MILHETPQGWFVLRKITVALSVILAHCLRRYQSRTTFVNKKFAVSFAGIVQIS
jgi:hypothetical protein